MKKVIYSKKYPKKERNEYIQEDFIELINRETENEFWADLLESKYISKLIFIDDRHRLRDKHMEECVRFANKNELDVEVLKGAECTCINLSFDQMTDLTEIKDSIDFADRVLTVSSIGDSDITLSLTFQTHKTVFFKKKEE